MEEGMVRGEVCEENGEAECGSGECGAHQRRCLQQMVHHPFLLLPRIQDSPHYPSAVELYSAGKYLPLLRLNHMVTMGTHNSYHVASSLPLSMHQYTHASLPHQLYTYRKGVRQLELDVHLIQGKPAAPKTEEASTTAPSGSSASNSDPTAPSTSSGSPSFSSAAPRSCHSSYTHILQRPLRFRRLPFAMAGRSYHLLLPERMSRAHLRLVPRSPCSLPDLSHIRNQVAAVGGCRYRPERGDV